jgi:hypothetical protein
MNVNCLNWPAAAGKALKYAALCRGVGWERQVRNVASMMWVSTAASGHAVHEWTFTTTRA